MADDSTRLDSTLPSRTSVLANRACARDKMAKRGAEKQLTQDNVEEDDRAEASRLSLPPHYRSLTPDSRHALQNGDGEFAKASEQALAGRK